MTRKEFLRIGALFGLGAPLASSLLTSCSSGAIFTEDLQHSFSGKVLIIGAGAAGLMAGYALQRYNVDFEILEASSVYGGRVKKIEGFADFPIDLGAEWIHTDPSILADLLGDENVNGQIEIIRYSPETLSVWRDGDLKRRNFFTNFYGEYKFKNTTWFDFFEAFVVPKIGDKIRYEQPVTAIDYSSDKVRVQTEQGEQFEADKIILTVPLTILKKELISFTPGLPQSKLDALDLVDMPDGIKVFLEFSERFYPDMFSEGQLLDLLFSEDGDRIYYDAAFRKDSNRHILGLFSVGQVSSLYAQMDTEENLIQFILSELDELFEGKASQHYLKHVVQNWSKEPYIQGSYSHYKDYGAQQALVQPLDDKVFFAGEAYPEASSTVHGAGISGIDAVESILTNES